MRARAATVLSSVVLGLVYPFIYNAMLRLVGVICGK
jgi:hypothetical protein